jgi:NADH-quinone oxidoreductase subunit G
LAAQYNVVREGWNGFNVLQTAASRVGALDIGFVPQLGNVFEKDVLFVVGSDEFDIKAFAKANSFIIYQGHHGDVNARHADVILPGAAFTEKDGLYVNLEGRVQMAKKAASPPGQAKEDWRIIRALADKLNINVGFDQFYQLRQKLVSAYPHFAKIDQIEAGNAPAPASDNAYNNMGVEAFVPFLHNFYQTNAIARASKTMADCSASFEKTACQCGKGGCGEAA